MAFSKNLYLTILIIFLIIGFWGLDGSPSFFLSFLPQKTLAATFQSSVTIFVCGDGTIDAGETCDDGGLNSAYGYFAAVNRGYCLRDCSGFAPYCGDGAVQSGYGEQCDDGNRTSGDGCSSACKTETVNGGGGGGGGGGGVYIPPVVKTKVIVQGIAYPLSSITVLQDGKVAATAEADGQANFKAEITEITAGIYTFGVWGEDNEGRRSITFTFTTSISSKTVTTIGGIFIPPTIELSQINLQRGETLNILGQTAPESEINIFISSPGEGIVEKTEAEADGTWFYPFDTTPLEEGLHISRAKAVSVGGLSSSFSKLMSFSLGKEAAEGLCPGADFNKDGRVNLVDFSILLYWWSKENSCCDQNQDGFVGITDFSIMLYYWTG